MYIIIHLIAIAGERINAYMVETYINARSYHINLTCDFIVQHFSRIATCNV